MSARLETHLFLVRHGRTALNALGVLRGHQDLPLDDVGRVQAYALAGALAYVRPRRIVSSPLLRARQTAEPLSAMTGLPLEVDVRLIDRDYGPQIGRTPAHVQAEFGSIERAPGVEPAEDVLARARAALDAQIEHLDKGPVVVVAHDAVNRLLLAHVEPGLGPAESIPQSLGCWNVLLRRDGRWFAEQVDQVPTAEVDDI